MSSVVVLLLGCFITLATSVENNVCPTFKDYYTVKNNSNCWYDFSADYEAPEVIRLNGYPVIEYRVPTADGFILRMFRIPSDNVKNPNAKSHPVYLQHGLVATCANFIGLQKNSLAFVLADAGYDVWLGNYRGNQYSEEHVNMTVFDRDYWEHTMDDIVQYDFPALFHTVLKHTDPDGKLIYIGHSLGTTLALMYAAEYPEIAEKTMKLLVLMSPAYTLSNMISPYKMAAPYGNAIIDTARRLELFRLVSQAGPLRRNVKAMCTESPPLMRLCMQMYNLFYGPNTQLGPEIIPVYFNQLPGGTALKILNHAADLVMGNFRKYDHLQLNFKYYGQATPPLYDIMKIRVPVYLIYSTQDWATPERDARNLWNNLPRRMRYGMKRINIPKFNHIDFIMGRHARQVVYNDLINVLNKAIEN